jgi:hypothetical protein
MHKDEAYIGMKVQRRYPSKRTATANVEKGVIKEIFRAMLKDKWLVLVDWEDGIPRIIALGYLRNRQEEEKETTEMTEEALADTMSAIKRKLPLDATLLTTDLKLRDELRSVHEFLGVKIDFETADGIVIASMVDQYHNLKKEIEWLKTIKNPLKYQKEDIEYNEKFLGAVVAIIKHYAVYSSWPEEMQDDGPWPTGHRTGRQWSAEIDKYKMHGLRYWDYMGSRLREEATHKTAGYTYLSSSILDAMMTRINALEHRCSELEWDSFGEPDMEDPQLELDV